MKGEMPTFRRAFDVKVNKQYKDVVFSPKDFAEIKTMAKLDNLVKSRFSLFVIP